MASSVQAAIVTLVASVGSVAVGFGAFTLTKEQIVVSAIGPVVGAIASIVAAITTHGKTIAAAQQAK